MSLSLRQAAQARYKPRCCCFWLVRNNFRGTVTQQRPACACKPPRHESTHHEQQELGSHRMTQCSTFVQLLGGVKVHGWFHTWFHSWFHSRFHRHRDTAGACHLRHHATQSSTHLKFSGVLSRFTVSSASALSAQMVVISASLHTSRASASSSRLPPAARGRDDTNLEVPFV